MPEGRDVYAISKGEEAGRVFGYVCPKNSCILTAAVLGQQTDECFTAPPSPTQYRDAHPGHTETLEGTELRTANIGGGVNHYDAGPFTAAVDHYANTASQLMRVRYGEDKYGIWAAGAMWPDLSERQVAMIRASALSGDWRWRPEYGAYDMAGSQLVNNPGFPLITQLPMAAALGEPPPLFGGWGGVPVVAATFNANQRKNLAKSGAAMPDGSFPIRNRSDLKNAIQAIGRAKNPAAAKAHIKKRARALGLTSLLPEGWTSRKAASAMKDHECTCGANDPDPVLAALTEDSRQVLIDEIVTQVTAGLQPFVDKIEEAVTRLLVDA